MLKTRESTAKDIADAAIRVWSTKKRQVTLDDIAKESKYSKSTVFYYKPIILKAGLLIDHDGEMYPPGLWEHIQKFFEEKKEGTEDVHKPAG